MYPEAAASPAPRPRPRPRPRPPGGGREPARIYRRPAARPRPRFVDMCAAAAGLGLGAVIASVITSQSRGALAAPGGLLTAIGELAALTGTYLILIMLVLVARIPWLERAAGQDQLLRWHRKVARWAISLIIVHVLTTTLGYAQAAGSPIVHEVWVLLRSYRDILAAAVGFGLLLLAAITSYHKMRRHLKYETWWVVHLYLYLALALAFAHQIVNGISFVGHPLTRGLWIAVWISTAGLVIVCRIGQPVAQSLRHQLRVVEIRQEAPGVVSVICQGRQLERLAVSGGQFFHWRFLTRDLWWQAHPFSLSALPRPPFLRVTIKVTGDAGQAVARLRLGTPVAIEGPYGTFTHQERTGDGLLLVGAGVGITPLRALLEDLPEHTDVVVILRASRPADLVHRNEIALLVQQHGGRLHEVVGSRQRVSLNPRSLWHVVPDIAYRDIYICGPEGFDEQFIAAATKLGVADEQIHVETFRF